MTRLNLLLLLVLLATSLYLVRVSYESRRLFAELDKAQNEERALDTDSERLKTELRSQATPLRVERTARESRSEFDRRAPFAAPRPQRLRALGRVKPRVAEAAGNPRARSAVMRVAERTEVALAADSAR